MAPHVRARACRCLCRGHTGAAPAVPLPTRRTPQWDKPAFLQEVAADHHLHHVPPQQIHDASAPVIDAHAHIGQNPAKDLLRQISAGEVPELKHVTLPPQ
jgi:hypothetical protein